MRENGAAKAKDRRVGELERLGPDGGEILVLGVDCPGFEDLEPRQKRFAYYMYRAAVAGNAIAFKQSHRDAYEIKNLLEQIYLHADGLDPKITDAVHDYLKFVWIHHGQYDHYSHTKFLPFKLTPAMLSEAAAHAQARGARIPAEPADATETIDQMLKRLHASIFDAEHEPLQTNQSEGCDIVAESAVNYWDKGITLDDLEKLEPSLRNKLNVRFARVNGDVAAQVYRIGEVYDEELRTICHFLELAAPHADDAEQRSAIETLIAYYHDGDEETFRRHAVHWLRSDSTMDFLNGFIEVYLDPRGVIGHFEANVCFKAGGGLIDDLADNALYFEQRMPWPDKYKRRTVERPVANLVNVIVETGDAGPVSPAAYNLPNYNDIRRDHGSKNVILHNIESTWSKPMLEKTAAAFYLPQYRENVVRYSQTVVRPLKVYMHEIIGHGSGQPDRSLEGDPRTHLGRVYSSLEECRADLVALYHITDPKLVELGAFAVDEQAVIVETTYVSFLQGWFSRFDRVPGHEVREAHNRGNHAIFTYLIENGGETDKDFGVDVVRENGDYFVHIRDVDKVRTGIGELLARIQIIKSTGDRGGAEALFDRFGTRLQAEWKDNVAERKLRLNIPKIKAFVFPRLQPVIEGGEITDVTIHHDEDLTAQQLRFSRWENLTDLDPA